MTTPADIQAEQLTREQLLDSGIVALLKQAGIVIWTLRAGSGQVRLAIDAHKLPGTSQRVIEEEISQLLGHQLHEMGYRLEVVFRPIAGNCCYGVCHGCLNGDPDDRKVWIDLT